MAMDYDVLGNSKIIGDTIIIDKNITVIDALMGKLIDKEKIKHIRFESGSKLRKFHKEAFADNKNLESIDLSACKELVKISANCFNKCINLQSVNLSNCEQLEVVAEYAFRNCENLESVNFKGCNNLTTLGVSCFEFCMGLDNVDLRDLESLFAIDDNVFSNCYSLVNIEMPNNSEFEIIGKCAFVGCTSLEKVDLSNSSVFIIGNRAFDYCHSLKKIDLSNCQKLTHIDGPLFTSSENVEEIDLRNSTNIKTWDILDGANSEPLIVGKVKISNELRGINNSARFNEMFENVRIEVYDKDKLLYEFDSNDAVYGNYKVLLLGLLSYAREKGYDVKPEFLNAFACKQELNFAFKNFRALSSLVSGKMLGGGKLDYLNESLVLLRTLGYFGVANAENGNGFDKRELEVYKNLLAKDLIYKKIKQEIKGDINKVYINKLIQEKTNKIARSYSLDKLVTLWVENNIVNHPHKEKLFYELSLFEQNQKLDLKFAEFFVLHFDEIMQEKISKVEILDRQQEVNEEYTDESVNGGIRLSVIHKKFEEILVNSNKQVVTRSDNQRLTLKDCEASSSFKNVIEGNEKLAEYCGNAHLVQEEFEILQSIFEGGKLLKDKQQLRVCKDDSKMDITYEMLEKDDPIGLVLGSITNCCQKIGHSGEPCMKIGATNVYSGFVVFKNNGKIIGQSWVWYDVESKTIALDNIEVPDVYYKLVNKEKEQEVKACVKRLCDNFYKTMTERGFKVDNIIIGKSATDMEFLDRDYFLETDEEKVIPCQFTTEKEESYSDILLEGQFVIYRDGKPFVKPVEKLSEEDRGQD
ncbi:MAG: leucine-rich repeat protein [Clostridia bacterium]|nr:leucine-rich repeat protein [Clostridia bacterium]